MAGKKKRTSRSWRSDQIQRSKQSWERGLGTKRKGNPRYKKVKRKGRFVYVLR